MFKEGEKASGFCSERMSIVSLPVGCVLPPNSVHRVKFPYLASFYIYRELEKLNAVVLSKAQMPLSLLERQKRRKNITPQQTNPLENDTKNYCYRKVEIAKSAFLSSNCMRAISTQRKGLSSLTACT